MTITNAESFASVAARERYVPRGLANTHSIVSLTMTSASPAYRQNFGPFASEVYHTPFPDEYRGWTTDRAMDALQELFDTRVTPDHVAASSSSHSWARVDSCRRRSRSCSAFAR